MTFRFILKCFPVGFFSIVVFFFIFDKMHVKRLLKDYGSRLKRWYFVFPGGYFFFSFEIFPGVSRWTNGCLRKLDMPSKALGPRGE